MHNEQPLTPRELALIARCDHLAVSSAASLFAAAAEDFQLLVVDNPRGKAVVALQGAQLLSYIPSGGRDLLWLSPNATLETGKAVRGGIPLCLPWFGVNQREPGKPKHGFARTSRWQLEEAITEEDGSTTLLLGLRQFNLTPHPLFGYAFEASLEIHCGSALQLRLAVKNCSNETLPLSWALHSYHPVDDLAGTAVSGLDGKTYLDNTRELVAARQQGDVTFNGELDRVYLDVDRQQTILGSPCIKVSGDNAPSAIVWNPGPELAASMADLGPGRHRDYLCLERGAAFDDEQSLAAGETMRATVVIAAAG